MGTHVNVGTLVRIELTRQQRTVSWLSEQLGIKRPNCYRILNATTIQTELLERICIAMQHDFFAEYSHKLSSIKIK